MDFDRICLIISILIDYEMKHCLLLVFSIFFVMPAFSQIQVENVSAFKSFPFSARNSAKVYDYFENLELYDYEKTLIPLDTSEIRIVESLINNAAIVRKVKGVSFGTLLGLEAYSAMIVTIDSVDHYFIIRDRSVLTEILESNKRKDYYFTKETTSAVR